MLVHLETLDNRTYLTNGEDGWFIEYDESAKVFKIWSRAEDFIFDKPCDISKDSLTEAFDEVRRYT